MKHTPTPWTINRGGGHASPSIRGSDVIHTNGRKRNKLGISSASFSEEVCQIHADLDLPGPQANARLIAAAPALLAACEKMVIVLTEPGMQDVDEWKHDKREAVIEGHAAIAQTKE